jgi:hypothetical protein
VALPFVDQAAVDVNITSPARPPDRSFDGKLQESRKGTWEGIGVTASNAAPGSLLAREMIGVWRLMSREDRSADGGLRIDPALGRDPIGILTYAPHHFAAQFMRRDRSNILDGPEMSKGENNTSAKAGYDAYFGSYEVDEVSGDVLHRLEAALSPENTGIGRFGAGDGISSKQGV